MKATDSKRLAASARKQTSQLDLATVPLKC